MNVGWCTFHRLVAHVFETNFHTLDHIGAALARASNKTSVGKTSKKMHISDILCRNMSQTMGVTVLRGFLSIYCHKVWYRNTSMVWLPMVKKVWGYDYSF